jgi:hypothetical protein
MWQEVGKYKKLCMELLEHYIWWNYRNVFGRYIKFCLFVEKINCKKNTDVQESLLVVFIAHLLWGNILIGTAVGQQTAISAKADQNPLLIEFSIPSSMIF